MLVGSGVGVLEGLAVGFGVGVLLGPVVAVGVGLSLGTGATVLLGEGLTFLSESSLPSNELSFDGFFSDELVDCSGRVVLSDDFMAKTAADMIKTKKITETIITAT